MPMPSMMIKSSGPFRPEIDFSFQDSMTRIMLLYSLLTISYLPMKVGFLLFQKRFHAFLLILRTETLCNGGYFQSDRIVQRHIVSVIDAVLRHLQGKTR